MWTLFKYLYRDASNYKAFGAVALAGRISDAERVDVRRRFESEEFFIAEQIGVPTLYEQLYQWSDGPIADDHCWHQFERFDEVRERPIGIMIAGRAEDFVARIRNVEEWQLELSPHVSNYDDPIVIWANQMRTFLA